MARVLLRRLAEWRPLQRAASVVERLDSSLPRILRVLTYHRVGQASTFASQMEHLARHYRVVSAAQVIAALGGGAALPRRSVLLTFDDGYQSFARVAWPILRAHGFPATLFVPTAYPDSSLEAFWWDRLERAFGCTPRRATLNTPFGKLPLTTAADRARSHAIVKARVRELPLKEALKATCEICSALGVPPIPHEVLGWDELRKLAAEGVTIGAHTRTHPRLDRLRRGEVRDEVLGSLDDVEREIPESSRIFAYPDGRHDDDIAELLRSAAVELAFTTRRGTNNLLRCDPLRLRRLNVDARDSAAVLRAKLAFTAARLEPALRLITPPSAGERRAERGHRTQVLVSKYVLRALDAVLTARLEPGTGPTPRSRRAARRSSRFEGVRRLTRLAVETAPFLGRALARALLRPECMPVRPGRIEVRAFGSGATVFRLDPGPDSRPWAVKVHRATLGRDLHGLLTSARRSTLRYQRLRATFGEVVLPGHFLVLHSPLCGARAVACLQPWLTGPLHDLLGLEEGELMSLLGRHPALARSLATFARQVLLCNEQGWFPDLLGPGNLLAVEEPGGLRLRLVDYGIFDRRERDPFRDEALDAMARRLESVAARWEENGRDL